MTIRKLVGTLENKGPYIDQSTGHWFYWNGTKYVDSGYPYAVKPVIEFKIENGILYYMKKERPSLHRPHPYIARKGNSSVRRTHRTRL